MARALLGSGTGATRPEPFRNPAGLLTGPLMPDVSKPPLPVYRVLQPPPETPPTLLVVIDTEEEFDWDAPFNRASTSVENIAHQDLAQEVFDAHGVVPTYVVDYPVATTPSSVAVLRAYQDAGRCEIGAHLHPWVNPPAEEEVSSLHSFASNLPPDLVRRKLEALRDAIIESFGRPPVVYKAGRYGIGPGTAALLRSLGFEADSSVVPHLDLSPDGGPDFRSLPDRPFLSEEGIAEVPLSVHFAGRAARFGPALFPLLERARRLRAPGIASRLGLLERLRLSPEGHSFEDMRRQTEAALKRGHRHLALTYHSSSLMIGGSPFARTAAGRDQMMHSLTKYLHYFMSIPDAATTTVSRLAAAMQSEFRS